MREKTRRPPIIILYSNLGWFWKVLIRSLLPKNSYRQVCAFLLRHLVFKQSTGLVPDKWKALNIS